MERLLYYLDHIHPLSDQMKIHLSSILKQKVVKKRNYLLHKGRICSEICFVSSGLLRCYYDLEDRKITSWFLKEGDVAISVKSFFAQIPSYESIQAIEDCEVYYITHAELQNFYKEFPTFNYNGRVLTEKYYLLKDEHSYQLQLSYSKDRLEWFKQNFPDILHRAPSRYVATFLGITEETLSRIRNTKKTLTNIKSAR